MNLTCSFYQSTIGKKVAMALSGLILVAFVVGHMVGNIKYFLGKDTESGVYMIDHYGQVLREIGQDFLGPMTFLWITRFVLLACLVIHVTSAIALARLNRSARSTPYMKTAYRSANAASRSMVYGGLFLLAFIIFHILHLTTGHTHLRGFHEGQVYHNIYNAFTSLPLAGFYVLAMACLMAHLYHGAWSMFQTLGVDSPLWNRGLRNFAKVVAIVLFLGFSSVPIATALNLMPLPSYTATSIKL